MGIWSKLGLAIGLTVVTTAAWAGPVRRARPGTTRAAVAPSRPLIEVKVNGRVYDGHSPINKRSTITVQAKAARGERGQYDLLSVSLLAQRSLGAPTKLADFVGEGDTVRVALGNTLKNDAPGTKIYVKLGRVQRKASAAAAVNVAIPEREQWIGLIIK